MKRSALVPRAFLPLLFLCISFSAITPPLQAQARSVQAHRQSVRSPIDRERDERTHRSLRPTTAKHVAYDGGSIMAGTARIYAIFWEPTGNVSPRYHSLIERYFHDVGSSPLYRIARQYTQADGAFPANSVLADTWTDTQSYHANALLDSDIQNEVTRAQDVNGWQSGPDNLFFVFTERNKNICIDNTYTQCTSNGYCAYHSMFGTNTLYATIPYEASFDCDFSSGPNHDDADQAIDNISHEQMEAATDPQGDGWIDADGNEIADKCVDNFGPLDAQGANVVWNGHPYRVQKEWDNQTGSCRLSPAA